MIPLYELNEMPVDEFVTTLGGLFGHSAWVARRVVRQRPFQSRFELLEAMCAAVAQASTDEQLSLIRAHPELTGKVAEQQARVRALNVQYRERFDCPFVFSAQGHEAAFAIAELERRLLNDPDTERREALAQIARIAGFKLAELIDEAAGAQILAMAERLTKLTEQRMPEVVRDWMLAAGLEAELDVSGNLVGRVRGEDAGGDVLVTGSCLSSRANSSSPHTDASFESSREPSASEDCASEASGSQYDGWLGILLPIVVAARLRREEVRLPFTLQIVACTDVAAPARGGFPGVARATTAHSAIGTGAMRAGAIRASATHAGVVQVHDSPRVLGFVAVALEQGHVLRNEDVPLAVATCIGERQCAPDMQELWADSIRQMTGVAHPLHIPSGAHTTEPSPVSLAPVSGMILRRSSHEPGLHEALSPEDAELAARAFLSFLTSFTPPD